MNEEELLQQAKAALAAGKSEAGVNARIEELSRGRYTDLRSLELALRMAGEMPGGAGRDTSAPSSFSGRARPTAVDDYLRAAAQGATFGFADEIAGMLPGGDAEASRANMARIRRERPVGSFIAETAGGALVPGLGGASIGRSVAARGGSRLAAGFIGGAVGGAAGGALSGAGEAEPGHRVGGAVMGGTVGGVAGGTIGLAAAGLGRAVNKAAGHTGEMREFARTRIQRALDEAGVRPEDLTAHLKDLGEGSVVADLGDNLGREARAATNAAPNLSAPGGPKDRIITRQMERGDRLAGELRSASRLGRSFDESLAEAEELVQEVRSDYYKPLERRYSSVTGPNVRAALEDPAVARAYRKVAPEAKGRAPSFTELQDTMMELRDEMTAARAAGRPNRSRKAAEAFDKLITAMEEDIPAIERQVTNAEGEVVGTETFPGFREAQQAFRIAARREAAHGMGQQFAFKEPRLIQNELGKLPDEAKDAFRMGMLDRWETALRETPTGGNRARSMIYGGDTSRQRLRAIVAGDEEMQRLLRGMEREKRWEATYRALQGNSTTVQQLKDVQGQMPQSVRATAWKIVTGIFGLSDKQRIAAAEMIGRTLLADGEEAARRLADDMRIRFSRPGAVGAIGGATAGREISTSRGGLLGD